MKASTFAQLILGYAAELVEGFMSSSDNEKYAQVKIDKALKTRWGASLQHFAFGGTKIREIAYPNWQNQGQIMDFGVLHTRDRVQSPNKPFNMANFTIPPTPKQTAYFIEIKTESGGNIGKFSGKSWKAAFREDIEKLEPASSWISYASFGDQVKGLQPTRGRCFAVLIAFHPKTSARIRANYQVEFPQSVCISTSIDNYSVCVLVQEV